MTTPSPVPTNALDEAAGRLETWMRALNGAAVAFSGGADSSLLLHCAAKVLGRRAIAVTFDTGTMPAFELKRASEIARSLGVRHLIASVDMFGERAFRENGPDRCYLCKRTLFARLTDMARAQGISNVLDGSNASDSGTDRPGMKALTELGVKSPLRELGIEKVVVRALAKAARLPSWNAPARACLATRIPTGTAVTNERVRRIEKLEEALLALGFSDVRAREDASGKCVRIEVPTNEIDMAAASAMRSLIADSGIRAGYTSISLDLRGLHSGKGQNG